MLAKTAETPNSDIHLYCEYYGHKCVYAEIVPAKGAIQHLTAVSRRHVSDCSEWLTNHRGLQVQNTNFTKNRRYR